MHAIEYDREDISEDGDRPINTDQYIQFPKQDSSI